MDRKRILWNVRASVDETRQNRNLWKSVQRLPNSNPSCVKNTHARTHATKLLAHLCSCPLRTQRLGCWKFACLRHFSIHFLLLPRVFKTWGQSCRVSNLSLIFSVPFKCGSRKQPYNQTACIGVVLKQAPISLHTAVKTSSLANILFQNMHFCANFNVVP
jgi:hypothetical protein